VKSDNANEFSGRKSGEPFPESPRTAHRRVSSRAAILLMGEFLAALLRSVIDITELTMKFVTAFAEAHNSDRNSCLQWSKL
jgi:hypothetical protein